VVRVYDTCNLITRDKRSVLFL